MDVSAVAVREDLGPIYSKISSLEISKKTTIGYHGVRRDILFTFKCSTVTLISLTLSAFCLLSTKIYMCQSTMLCS